MSQYMQQTSPLSFGPRTFLVPVSRAAGIDAWLGRRVLYYGELVHGLIF